VYLNDVVFASAGGKEFSSETAVQIFKQEVLGGVLTDVEVENLVIHTSCSQPLNLGDRFGAVEIVAMGRKDDGFISMNRKVEYEYVVANPTLNQADGVNVMDDLFGPIVIGAEIPGEESKSFFERVILPSEDFPLSIGESLTNTAELTQGDPNGPVCAEASATVTLVESPVPPVTPGSCADGKPQALVFEYQGNVACSASINTQPSDKWYCDGLPGDGTVSVGIIKDPNKIEITGSNVVTTLGDTVTLTKIAGAKDFGAETQLNVGGQFLEFHTSCSQPLNVGDQFGSLKLIEFIPIQ